jgi:hypothetical protein
MNLIEINEKVQEIESSQDLLHWKIGKWSVWPILRFNIASITANLTVDSTDIRLSISEHFQQSLRDIISFKWGKHPQVLLYVASSNRVEQQKDHYKDVIFDDILQYLSGYFKVEIINNKYYRERSHAALYPSDMTTSGIFLLTNILSRFLKLPSIDHTTDIFFNTLQKYLPEFNVSRRYIYRNLSTYYWAKKIYSSLISHLKPQIILLQTAYTNHALVAAAKEANTLVIEFQHGIVDRHHPGYSWTTYATTYKNQMPIPDRIFLYGEYWREELCGNGFWNKELRSVGSLRIDQYRSLRNLFFSNKARTRKISNKIVVTTQALDVERLALFLLEFIKTTTKATELFIKLHPREFNRRPYETAFSDFSNVHIISGHDSPSTFELLSMADYHASIHSTCHYEALGLGIPTIILPFTNYERMLPLCEQASGYAMVARSPAEMNQITIQERVVPLEFSSYYFREGAVNNMLDEIQNMGLNTTRIHTLK